MIYLFFILDNIEKDEVNNNLMSLMFIQWIVVFTEIYFLLFCSWQKNLYFRLHIERLRCENVACQSSKLTFCSHKIMQENQSLQQAIFQILELS
jgi:hypothetical protein